MHSRKNILREWYSYLETVILVDFDKAMMLTSNSLTEEGLEKWLAGKETTKEVVPLGYAGNPAGYKIVEKHIKEMLDLQATDIADRIRERGKNDI